MSVYRQQIERVPVTARDDVRLHEIDSGHWRVLDSRLPSDDVRALLGFVERQGSCIEVTLLGAPGDTRRCRTLDDARDVFVADQALGRPADSASRSSRATGSGE